MRQYSHIIADTTYNLCELWIDFLADEEDNRPAGSDEPAGGQFMSYLTLPNGISHTAMLILKLRSGKNVSCKISAQEDLEVFRCQLISTHCRMKKSDMVCFGQTEPLGMLDFNKNAVQSQSGMFDC